VTRFGQALKTPRPAATSNVKPAGNLFNANLAFHQADEAQERPSHSEFTEERHQLQVEKSHSNQTGLGRRERRNDDHRGHRRELAGHLAPANPAMPWARLCRAADLSGRLQKPETRGLSAADILCNALRTIVGHCRSSNTESDKIIPLLRIRPPLAMPSAISPASAFARRL
jgi:hypothetical protein